MQNFATPVHFIYQGRELWVFSSGGFLQSRHAPCFWTRYHWHTVHSSFPSPVWSPTLDILSGPTPPSQVICCSRYPSSQRAAGVGEKFLPQIKWLEIKMLPQHVPWRVTLKEISPLAALTETPQFLKTTRAQFDCIQFCNNKAGCLNESQARFTYVRELEEFSAPNLLTSTSCCERLSQYAAFHFLKSLLLYISSSISLLHTHVTPCLLY